jgi:malonyl-CoA/methylmalonyl-CoA synthetase
LGVLAIHASDGSVTYKDFARGVSAVAAALNARYGDDLEEARVAFFVHPGVTYAELLYGIWRAGGIAVPLAVSHPPAELEYVIRDSGAALAIAEDDAMATLAPVCDAVGVTLVRAADVAHTSAVDDHANEETSGASRMQPTRRAMILYTSGTTGRPKGVVTTHGNIAAQIGALVTAWEWSPDDRALLVLPLHHVHGIINLLGCALASRAACDVLPQFDVERTWDRLASGGISVFSAVPTIYHRLIASWDAAPPVVQRQRSEGCRSVRLMMSGSAALPVRTLDRWREITGHTLLERYGMTEIGMALSNPVRGTRRPGCVGTPLPGVTVRIVDDEGQPVEAGTAGELEVRGPGVFLEYWRRPDETRDAFRDGWFRTGDVAVIEEGVYRLLGRMSVDIIKTGGFKVSALQVEEVLRSHPLVSDCAVVGVPDLEWGERVCAVVEARTDDAPSVDDLKQWARTRLAAYKVPKDIRFVAAMPRNAMGKVVKPDIVRMMAGSGA